MRHLILPCETRSRELDAKLLLAVVAAGRGISSIVGAKKVIDLEVHRYPSGVYIGKSVTGRSRHNLLLARASGHRTALWDEEGLVWASREIYWRTKVDGRTLGTPELLLAWGEENAEAWRSHPAYTGTPIACTGNPRADLLEPNLTSYHREDVERLSRSLGRFVLINTNFSRVNHAQPRQNRHLKWLRENRPEDPRGAFAAHKNELYGAFRRMLPELAAARPDIHFVVRPHPSESLTPWQALARGHDNLTVEREGAVVPWLLAAEALIHNGCTTAVEAYALGRPSLAFMPVRSERFDHPLPNGLSVQCDDLPTLLAAVDTCWRNRDGAYRCQSHDPPRQALMARNLAGRGTGSSACERICEALEPLLREDGEAPPRRRSVAALLAARRLGWRLQRRIPGSPSYGPYLAQMFAPTSVEEIRHRVERLAACLGGTPPSVSALGENVFLLEEAPEWST